MDEKKKVLHWIKTQEKSMVDLAVRFSLINSHTFNLEGLNKLAAEIKPLLAVFGEKVKSIEFPDYETTGTDGNAVSSAIAPLLCLRKRPEAPKQVLLMIHMDTVYPVESKFDTVKDIGQGRLNGPGITDAKGGIVVMLKALEAFEQSAHASKVGWQVIINTDEEIGSPASAGFLAETAPKYDIGLVFEPCLPDGSMVASRKGSGHFTLTAKGQSAHAGRDPEKGRNAIVALAECITKISSLTNSRPGLTLNVGTIKGGTAANVVPDWAMAVINVRYKELSDQAVITGHIKSAAGEIENKYGVQINLGGQFSAPPKNINDQVLSIMKLVEASGRDLGVDITWQDSGGVSDGNRLQAAGLPTVDTLGVCGGNIHSFDEYIEVNSLVERTQLTALSLLKWAGGQ